MNPFARRPRQAALFERIVASARTSNPFYAGWITDPEDVPILDRETFVANNDRILDGHPVTGWTSGSTAEPVRIHTPRELARVQAADTARYVSLLGGRKRPVVIRDARPGVEGAAIVDLRTPLDEQIEIILRLHRERGVNAITTFPSNAELLCVRLLERGISLPFIERVGLYAEMVTPVQRELIARAFPQAQFWTTYSTSEFGMVGFDCPHEPGHYHLTVHRLGVEIVDDAGAPVPAGRHWAARDYRHPRQGARRLRPPRRTAGALVDALGGAA
jgi:acyl-coenzyme A synthetase/AMP-(fatty) acid ligase